MLALARAGIVELTASHATPARATPGRRWNDERPGSILRNP